jgi:hypothetical protein
MEFSEMIDQLSIPEEAFNKFDELVDETEKMLDAMAENESPSRSRFLDSKADYIYEIENLMKDCTKTTFEGREDYVSQYMKRVGVVPAEHVYLDLLLKVANAPTRLHIMASIKNLIPIIAEKLRERNGEKNDE